MAIVAVPPRRGPYGILPGSFGLPFLRRVEWHYCREQFHLAANVAIWRPRFFFCHKPGRRDFIIHLITQVERRLNLWCRTKIYETDTDNVICVRPAPFWRLQWMRFSLFTIILRVGNDSKDGDAIEDAMQRSMYTKRTLPAVEHFLSGNTWFTGWGLGWADNFAATSQRTLARRLVPAWQACGIHYVAKMSRWLIAKL